ncbi:E3 ubiquitin-protein ligase TTC3 isoform X2 [Parambassis ranga]|uniref:RING-type E3 ubiquitin transferase n=1 Tax=Parambassis ranga TaxID=210632 RepID=A0A6P7JKD1_9TELE|nr:E3 ubiquitin-protein ligase TTC3 isoform X2 [Parambassis ranga]
MSDSDSDSDYGDWQNSRCKTMKNDTVITFRPQDSVFERWSQIPLEIKKEAGQRMKICVFWLPILLQRDESSNAVCWAAEIGLISSKNTEDLSLKHLRKIETVETILRALEQGSLKKDQSKHVISISNMLNLHRTVEVLDDALHWLEQTGEPDIRTRLMDLGHGHTCFTALHFIFTEFAKYIQDMGGRHEKTMKSLMAKPGSYSIEKCEEMKKKGNENFQKQQYEDAVIFYSKAITFYPDNHIIYSNRALCYIRCKKYLKAVCDGKRAVLIKPHWAKGHYRYCEALFFMGKANLALEANRSAQLLCNDDQDGMKELEQQLVKFLAEIMAAKTIVVPTRKTQSFKVGVMAPRQQPVKTTKVNPVTSTAPKVSESKRVKKPGKIEKMTHAENNNKDKLSKSEVTAKNGKEESNTTVKKKPSHRNGPAKEEEAPDSKARICRELRSLVQDAHTALSDLRSRNAEQAFSQALALMDKITPKELGLSTLDQLLLLFGRASALTEIGQPEELGEAQKLLEKMKSYEERTFQCLVYYTLGKVYLKENRFVIALEQFSDSLQMVKNQITPGKLTWPLTKEIVKESQLDYFKETLEGAIELCKFPPPPDAVCRMAKCLSQLKSEIYLTDPDFKGFIQIRCCHSCTVEYHMTCWKTLKTSALSEKNEKDLLQEPCLTPDCFGQICSIKIFGPTGLVKCKFETTISKPQTAKKQKMNQICTSLKKLKSKEERHLRRKQHKGFQDKETVSDENLHQKDDSATQSQQKAWLVYRDRVLLQISQHMELLREEKGLHVSALSRSLKPWLELDLSRGNQLAGRILNWQQERLETLGQAIELLLERKNRVWARVFIQQLSSCVDINPKLNTWACRLNDAGLDAAQSFIERYTEHLEQLDLSIVLTFGPLQDMVIEKLGTRPELFSSIGLTLTEYLKQAPPQDMRLFIWTLEEHRDDCVSCHTILDEYFDMMDGHCSVLKKFDENENNSPMKCKSRKKKQKGQKGVIGFQWSRVASAREESTQDFFEDDSLSFLHPGDPFSVPSHLREQVADFEEQYSSRRHRHYYKQILDNNPDPTKESLYDYFAQILEEHGPLVAEDPLLVGELRNFPSEAQQKIHAAGGFEHFLLDSLRFIKMGRCIGLTKHAVSLQQAGHGASLDDLDEILDADNNSSDLIAGNGAAFLNSYSLAQTDMFSILPNPYVLSYQPADTDFSQAASQNAFYHTEMDLYTSEGDAGFLETDPTSSGVAPLTREEHFMINAAAQTCREAMRSVAVNTELHERFESCQGDINKKEKSNQQLEQMIKKMENGNGVNPAYREDIISLEEDVQKITANIQVTNTELMLFQQKLEEEVKKDQKEKKANQEVLKALKQELDELLVEHESLAQSTQEKKANYEAKLNDFLERSNQSAAEKMSLEDEIKRCKDLLSSSTRRSLTAQLSVVESSRDQGLYGLYRELADAKALLAKLDEAAHWYPNQELEMTRNDCRAKVEEIESRISTVEHRHQELMDRVKNGRGVGELPPVNNQSEPGAASATSVQTFARVAKEFTPQASAQVPRATPPYVQQAAPPAAEVGAAGSASAQQKPLGRMELPYTTVFDKAIETLTTMFPDYTKPDLMRFVQELRSSSGGSLSSMSLQDVVSGVTQLILDHQDRLNAARANSLGRGSPSQRATPPLVNPTPVWQPVSTQRTSHSSALNTEDPCIICHEDMNPMNTCVLACRHSFHEECIRQWLKAQSTCPTCRTHALLPDDFPALSCRRRQAP